MEDGALTATIARNKFADMYNFTYQMTPFVEATFRYSVFSYLDTANYSSNAPNFSDRSYEVKARLMEEQSLIPALAVGIRDVIGTGVLSAEYLVASKTVGSLDVSLGLGWGRLGGRGSFRNPLGLIADQFNQRPLDIAGGEIRGDTFFRGDTSLFGGLSYSFVNLPVSFTLEYSSDEYQRERSRGALTSSKPYNLGFTWKPIQSASLSVNWYQNAYLGLTVRAVTDFAALPKRRRLSFDSVMDPQGESLAPAFLNLQSWYDRFLFDAERSGLEVYAAHLEPGDEMVAIELGNKQYAMVGDALNQALVLSEIHLPKEVNKVQLNLRENQLAASSVGYILQRGKGAGARSTHAKSAIQVSSPRELKRRTHATDYGYPKLALGADLAMRVQLMDPKEPLKHQLYIKGTARLAISDHLNLWSAYTMDVSNDFNTNRPSDSVLPRVRSEINRYLTEGENGIDSIYLEEMRSLSPQLHGRAYVGLLEEMFGGVGVELLYEPFAQRWAIGGNLNWVRQRDYAKDFSFIDYEVVTGHASLFYASPWYNFDFAIHAGRYLAGDRGLTYEARRTFDNGFSIGAFFTRTNVSARDFGEGNFDKGLYLKIPFDLFLPRNTRASYRTIIRSLERDGGRRLEGFAGELWWDRRAVRYDALDRQVWRMHP